MAKEPDNMELEIIDDEIIIKIDTTKEFGVSSSEKSIIVATSRGNREIEGTKLFIGLNVYYKNPDYVKPPRASKKKKKEKEDPMDELKELV